MSQSSTATMAEQPSLDTELSLWLLDKRPGLLVADASACGEACRALANTLGVQLATVLALHGDAAFEGAMRRMFRIAHDSARAVSSLAQHESSEGTTK